MTERQSKQNAPQRKPPERHTTPEALASAVDAWAAARAPHWATQDGRALLGRMAAAPKVLGFQGRAERAFRALEEAMEEAQAVAHDARARRADAGASERHVFGGWVAVVDAAADCFEAAAPQWDAIRDLARTKEALAALGKRPPRDAGQRSTLIQNLLSDLLCDDCHAAGAPEEWLQKTVMRASHDDPAATNALIEIVEILTAATVLAGLYSVPTIPNRGPGLTVADAVKAEKDRVRHALEALVGGG